MADQETIPAPAENWATQPRALRLRELSLIGTAGTDTSRRALVRMPNGAIETVTVGDILRGRRVDAIEADRVLMSRNGRQSILAMPQG